MSFGVAQPFLAVSRPKELLLDSHPPMETISDEALAKSLSQVLLLQEAFLLISPTDNLNLLDKDFFKALDIFFCPAFVQFLNNI